MECDKQMKRESKILLIIKNQLYFFLTLRIDHLLVMVDRDVIDDMNAELLQEFRDSEVAQAIIQMQHKKIEGA